MAIAHRHPGALNIHLKGHADVTRDTAELQAAETALNVNGGTLWLEGHFKTSDYYSFTDAVDVRRVGTQAIIEVTSAAAVNLLGWNRTSAWDDGSSYSFTMANAFADRFSPVAYSPSPGDWVYLEADNDLSGVPIHTDGGSQRPMELHQVVHWDSTGGYAYTEGPIIDYMTTTPTVNTVAMTQGPVIEGIEFMLSAGVSPTDYTHFLTLHHCVNARIINCTFHRLGVGAVDLYGCANLIMDGCTLDGMIKEDGIYAGQISLCNGVLISNCHVTGYRHGITTASGRASGSTRWGTPLNIVVENNTLHCHPKMNTATGATSTTTGILDTHAEGYGTIFQGNRITIQGGQSNTAINIRNRSAIVRNNTVIGGHNTSGYSSATGVAITGPDARVSGNHFERLFYGVRTTQDGYYYSWSDGAEIYKNVFRDIQGAPVRIVVGDNAKVYDNDFGDCGRQAVGLPQVSAVHINFGDLRQHAVTFTAASQNVTCATNDLYSYSGSTSGEGLEVYFTTTGSLPTELTAGKANTYFIVSSSSATVFQISATREGTAITFSGTGSGTHTMHGPGLPGTGHEVLNNTSVKTTNANFIETGDLDDDDLEVHGNTVIGYAGAAFSDRYSKRSEMQTAFSSTNTGM